MESHPNWIITAEELKAIDRNVFLLDVRSEEEFQQGAIDSATLIPLPELDERAEELDRNQEIIVYCHLGMRSLEALMILKQKGFNQVRTLQGGIEAWKAIH